MPTHPMTIYKVCVTVSVVLSAGGELLVELVLSDSVVKDDVIETSSVGKDDVMVVVQPIRFWLAFLVAGAV